MSAASAPPPPHASVTPTAPSTVSRADILRAGQTAAPWTFVPLALQVLDRQPADEDLRLLLVRHLTTLGLRTAASEHLAVLSRRAQSDARTPDLAAAVAALPDDRIPLETLEATCRANAEALARRPVHPVNLRLHVSAWRAHAAKFDWFRAIDGNIVRRARRPADASCWLHLEDNRSSAAKFSYTTSGSGPEQAPTAPIVLEGLDPPWLFQHLCQMHPPRPNGYWIPITLIQSDPLEFLDALAQTDLTTELAQSRVRVMVGPNAGRRFAEALMTPEGLDRVVTGPVITSRTLRSRAEPRPAASIDRAGAAQSRLWDSLRPAVLARYSTRDAAYYAKRLTDARQGTPEGTPLRVVVITCRYTTFVKHSAADLAQALSDQGHNVRIVIEPDDSSWIGPIASLRAIHEHDPDLIVTINYPRSTMSSYLPPQLPVLTWVQDGMQQLLDPELGRSLGLFDFMIGNVYHEHFEKFHYPREQCLAAPMVASSRKFHTSPIDPQLAARFTCDIAYVSHHSETPEALHEQRVELWRNDRPLAAALEALFPLIQEEIQDALSFPLTLRLTDLTARVLPLYGINPEPTLLSRVMHLYTFQVADRAIRHQTLAWAADAARRNRWTMHLYGRGWSSNPSLAEFARGELSHGEELRACYAAAKTHLQVTLYRVMHQRVIECALSGGFPLMRLHSEDVMTLHYAAAVTASRRSQPSACHLEYTRYHRSPSLGYPAKEHPEGVRLNSFLERMNCPRDDFLWLADSHRSRALDSAALIDGDLDLFWLLGDPAPLMFTCGEQLESRIRRAVTDADHRSRATATLVERSRECLTHDAFARRSLDFIGARLNRELTPP